MLIHGECESQLPAILAFNGITQSICNFVHLHQTFRQYSRALSVDFGCVTSFLSFSSFLIVYFCAIFILI